MEYRLRKSSSYARTLVAAVVLLVASLALSLYSQRRALSNIERVHHADLVLRELYELNALLNVVQTEQRGYLVTGQDEYHASFSLAKQDVAAQLDLLDRLTAGDAESQERITYLTAMTEVKMRELDRASATRATEGFNAAQLIEKSDLGRQVMMDIREKVREMILMGGRDVDDRRRALVSSVRRVNWTIMVAGMVALGIGGVGALLLTIALRAARREERLEREKRKAERSDREKSRFLANMSHEIRTPLNAILGFSELLNDCVSSDRAKRHIAAIRSSGEALLSLINDILDLSKVEAGKLALHPEPADLREMGGSLRTLFSETALAKKLTFEISVENSVPKIIVIDELRLRQIFINLLSNAIKFTSEGRVVLRLWCESSELPGHLNLLAAVSDTGCGISEQDQKQIFKPFAQVSANEEAAQNGTGLGLSICKRLVDLMNGTLEVDSEPGRGSVFRVSLPDIAVLQDASKSAVADSNTNGGVERFQPSTLLIVDDNPLNRELLVEIFADSRHKIILACDGREAVDLTIAHKPDVVLMDVRMPGMDGKTARAAIRNRADIAPIPVIAVTASSMVEEEQRLREEFDGFIRKPFARDDVVRELALFLPPVQGSENGREEASVAGDAVGTVDVPASEEGRRHWAELAEELRQMRDEAAEIRKVMMVGDVARFGLRIAQLGRGRNCPVAVKYGEELRRGADNFDNAGMEATLERFDSLMTAVEAAAARS